jgi:seryl-tRNA synthetase
MCYHVYNLKAGQTLPAAGAVYGLCGHCFRYEADNLGDLRRLWDFTLREVVFLGRREDVLARRDEAIARTARFLEAHELAGEIRTASDPFFAAPDALAKTYFQLSAETKYEVSLLLPGSERLAVGSLNYHTDFFGRAFDVTVEGAGPMHSVCVGFGLERWVYAFVAQHGADPRRWPAPVRVAAEVQGST